MLYSSSAHPVHTGPFIPVSPQAVRATVLFIYFLCNTHCFRGLTIAEAARHHNARGYVIGNRKSVPFPSQAVFTILFLYYFIIFPFPAGYRVHVSPPPSFLPGCCCRIERILLAPSRVLCHVGLHTRTYPVNRKRIHKKNRIKYAIKVIRKQGRGRGLKTSKVELTFDLTDCFWFLIHSTFDSTTYFSS